MEGGTSRQMQFSARTFEGFEQLLANELERLGASNIELRKRAVRFSGDLELLYKANLHCRTALRIHQVLFRFKARHPNQLYTGIARYDWTNLFDVNQTFAIDSIVHSPIFRHAKFAGQKAKDAIVDQFRDFLGERPSVDLDHPDFRIQLRIDREQVELSLDSSGESLHKRGYRLERMTAPLNEVLAAGLVKLSGWGGKGNFYDPMCGSGTIPIEAAMIACNIPPGMFRSRFGFMNWANWDEELWKQVVKAGKAGVREPAATIFASDQHRKAIGVARRNAGAIGVEDKIQWFSGNFVDKAAPADGGVVVMNPPYGERMKTDVFHLYKNVGDTMKQRYAGWKCWVFTSNKDALKKLGLKTSKRLNLYNGPLECSYFCYELYAGSKKAKYQKTAEEDGPNGKKDA